MSLKESSTKYDFVRDAQALLTETRNLLAEIQSAYNAFQFGPSVLGSTINPQGAYSTTSKTGVMVGYGFTFTPVATGRVLIIAVVSLANNTAGDGVWMFMTYGTGNSPNPGASITGTYLTGQIEAYSETANQPTFPTVMNVVTGLKIGTTYWFDVAVSVITGGTGTVNLLSYVVIEF